VDGPRAYVATLDIETVHREAQRLSPYAARTIQHPNGVSVTTLVVENAAKHHCLSHNGCFPVLEYLVIVSSKFVVRLRGIGHDAF
jgi:hypothetical protein